MLSCEQTFGTIREIKGVANLVRG